MHVFISYSRDAGEVAKIVEDRLEQLGHKVWHEGDLRPGDEWREKTAAELRRADSMIFLLTPESVGTKNFWFEVGVAAGRRAVLESPLVIPVLLKGADGSILPRELNDLYAIDASDDVDPRVVAEKVARAVSDAPSP